MAYTKIHAIKATVNKAIDYICNPDKTDDKLLISSYACAPETAAIDFKYTLAHTSQHDENKAYHLIQSFLPGEVSFKEAHRIGKFSDELCAEHNLSIIKTGNERGKSYKEWQVDRNGGSGKTTMRKDINDAIRHASSYDEFLMLMRAKGYEIKGEDFGEDSVKYIAFRTLDKEHFVRGSARSLGKDYTKERIKERIKIQLERKAKKKVLLPKKDYSKRNLVDTSDEKFQSSPGLKRWEDIENLKAS